MARKFAATLGYLAAALVLFRGAIGGAGIESTLLRSIVVLAIFVVVGLVLGAIAETTVVQSVREQFERQIEQQPGDAIQ